MILFLRNIILHLAAGMLGIVALLVFAAYFKETLREDTLGHIHFYFSALYTVFIASHLVVTTILVKLQKHKLMTYLKVSSLLVIVTSVITTFVLLTAFMLVFVGSFDFSSTIVNSSKLLAMSLPIIFSVAVLVSAMHFFLLRICRILPAQHLKESCDA